MIISVRMKLFLNIFNYKVIFQCFHYFLFEKKFGQKNFFNHYLVNITLWLDKEDWGGFYQKQISI